MKKALFTIAIALLATTATVAQEHERRIPPRPPFSPEEFQAIQRAFITERAGLTPEEANAFFPLFFELQKKKFDFEHDARKDTKKPRGERLSEEECRELVYKMADTRIEIAKLEREYTDKYLKVLKPCKLHKVIHAEGAFQRHLMKEMTRFGEPRRPRD
ncbi:MAG: hypothetical protein IKV07_00370 [Bacteroidaceae bacterium]|nr:hypothetical protein [Bacteroidaceae bacterium]